MKKDFLRGLLGLSISMVASTGLFAEDLSNTSYYDCGYDAANPSKCMLYMPTAKLLATHTAGSLTDYKDVQGVVAVFDNGTLTLPTITGLSDADNIALSGRSDIVDFYYIQQSKNGVGGSPMFYLYSPSANYLAEHEAGKMGSANVTDLKTKLSDGSFTFDVKTGIATATVVTTITDIPTTGLTGTDIPPMPTN